MHILVSSRNNYEMLEGFFLKKNDFPSKNIINVDAGSTEQNLSYGKKICDREGITFLKTQQTGLQSVVKETIQHIRRENNSKWLLYLHTDAYLLPNTYNRLVHVLDNKFFAQFGLIGFNTIFWPHTIKLNQINPNDFYFGLMGKSLLSNNNLSVYGPHTIKNASIKKSWNNLVAVEAVMDIGILINIDYFDKFIFTSESFPFVCAFDDIAMQFLNKNIFNVTLPDFYCVHDPWIKKEYNMPVSSPKELRKKFNRKFYNDDLKYVDEWKNKWKFDRQYKNLLKKPIVNNGLLKNIYTHISNLSRLSSVHLDNDVKNYYNNNLIGKFIEHSNLMPFHIFSEYEQFTKKYI